MVEQELMHPISSRHGHRSTPFLPARSSVTETTIGDLMSHYQFTAFNPDVGYLIYALSTKGSDTSRTPKPTTDPSRAGTLEKYGTVNQSMLLSQKVHDRL